MENTITSIHNFRDLGGLITSDGRMVRTGILFRSGHLSRLKSSCRRTLHNYNVQSVADFRSDFEVKREPDKVPKGIQYCRIPVISGGPDIQRKVIDFIRGKTEMSFEGFMETINRDFVLQHTPAFRSWLHGLVEGRFSLPHLFHCTAGKDRTGFAAAILLLSLGVSRADVLDEYMKSHVFLTQTIKRVSRQVRWFSLFRRTGLELVPLLDVRPEYLLSALEEIDSRWGNFETYLKAEEGLGMTTNQLEELKKRCLI